MIPLDLNAANPDFQRGKVGETLSMEGLLDCSIAIVVRSNITLEAGNWDKMLVHIKSDACGGDKQNVAAQLDKLLYLNDNTPFNSESDVGRNKQAFALAPPDNGNQEIAQFKEVVLDALKKTFFVDGNVVWMNLDMSRVHEDNGSRMWIDRKKRVHWGADGTIIVRADGEVKDVV